MRLLDVNLLLYAVDETSPRHHRARSWLEEVLSGTETVALSWTVLLGFVRLSTQSRVFTSPLTATQALDLVDSWLALPNVALVAPTRQHATVLRGLLQDVGTAGNLTIDAHLAALALEHNATLCSADADFRRFEGLRWLDPLVGR